MSLSCLTTTPKPSGPATGTAASPWPGTPRTARTNDQALGG
jgi:hypothetical protein